MAESRTTKGMSTHKSAKENMDLLQDKLKFFPHWLADTVKPISPDLAHFFDSIVMDAPFVLLFCFCCLAVQLSSSFVGKDTVDNLFSARSKSQFRYDSPYCYLGLLTHVFNHGSFAEMMGNITLLLLVGPVCEYTFGSLRMSRIMLFSAVGSGLAHLLLGKTIASHYGCSGIVFALILLNAIITTRSDRIPMSNLCLAGLWCYREIAPLAHSYETQMSHVAHITGAIVGTAAGFQFRTGKA